MRTVWLYISSRLKRNPISWAEAKRRADDCNVLDVVFEKIDKVLLRFVSMLLTYKLFFYVNVGLRLDRLAQKIHTRMVTNMIGRYILKMAAADTDLRNYGRGPQAKTGCVP